MRTPWKNGNQWICLLNSHHICTSHYTFPHTYKASAPGPPLIRFSLGHSSQLHWASHACWRPCAHERTPDLIIQRKKLIHVATCMHSDSHVLPIYVLFLAPFDPIIISASRPVVHDHSPSQFAPESHHAHPIGEKGIRPAERHITSKGPAAALLLKTCLLSDSQVLVT